MVETSFVRSTHFNQNFRIHGHLAHDLSPANKQRWFIYLVEDIPCQKFIVGSTTAPTKDGQIISHLATMDHQIAQGFQNTLQQREAAHMIVVGKR
jgi:hypothetical protein